MVELNHLLSNYSIIQPTYVRPLDKIHLRMLICMGMLTKRTQILFDEQLWNTLVQIAKTKNTSVGQLVRSAAREKYEEDNLLQKRKKAVEKILSFSRKYGKQLAKGEDSTSIIRRMRDTRYGSPK